MALVCPVLQRRGTDLASGRLTTPAVGETEVS